MLETGDPEKRGREQAPLDNAEASGGGRRQTAGAADGGRPREQSSFMEKADPPSEKLDDQDRLQAYE